MINYRDHRESYGIDSTIGMVNIGDNKQQYTWEYNGNIDDDGDEKERKRRKNRI